jgi:hypothetical protein
MGQGPGGLGVSIRDTPLLKLPEIGGYDSISTTARRAKSAIKRHTVRVRGRTLDLLDRIPFRDGDEVLVTVSEAIPMRDIEALRAAAGLGGVWSMLMHLSPPSMPIASSVRGPHPVSERCDIWSTPIG